MLQGFDGFQTIHQSDKVIVSRARRVRDNLSVVLKRARSEFPSPEEQARLRHEYEVLRRLELPGVVRALELVSAPEGLALVLEDARGRSLRREVVDGGMPLARFLELAPTLARLVGQVHQARVIHKDLNPSNILVLPQDNALQLIDFEFASLLSNERVEPEGAHLVDGTLAYVSPEQTGRMNRAVDWRADLYSLGATYYELLTGQTPFQGLDAMELVHAHLARMPAPPHVLRPEVPPALSAIVMKLLEKVAEERYQSAFGLAHDLEEVRRRQQEGLSLEGFVLASRDASERFQVPQHLYGREEEVRRLTAAYERVMVGSAEVLLVAGSAGSGKSALVQQVYRSSAGPRGYFIRGKFDQFGNVPHASFIRAFRDLIQVLLAESEERVRAWKERLTEALGPNAGLVSHLIPELELLIGEQPPEPELPSEESRNRVNVVLLRFIQCFAGEQQPLIIFLDDLQWADLASLELLRRLMTDAQTRHLLLLGAYRDDEVGPTHPFKVMREGLLAEGTRVEEVELGPLTRQQVLRLVSDAVHRPGEECGELVDVVMERARGNPFFVRELLTALYETGGLRFELASARWCWDLERVRSLGLTENVVSLMAGRLQRLPEDTQRLLELGACIGSRFDLRTLALVIGQSVPQVARTLWPALDAGLIAPLGSSAQLLRPWDSEDTDARGAPPVCQFSHDRVQQAAYERLPEPQRQQAHLRIGRLLMDLLPDSERRGRLFEIVQQLDQALELITDAAERERLARLNLEASTQARRGAAYQAAFLWLRAGLELLAPDGWTSQYPLALALHCEAAEVARLAGDFETMERLCGVVLERALEVLDRIPSYETRIQFYISQNRPADALDVSREALLLLGVSLPARPGVAQVGVRLLSTRRALRKRGVEALGRLPRMSEPRALAAMGVLMRSVAAAYIASTNTFALIVFEMVRLSLAHGNCPQSPFGYMTYSVLAASLGDVDEAHALGRFSLELMERLQVWELRAKLIVSFNVTIEHWKRHASCTLEPLLQGHHYGLEAGDLEYACHNAMYYSNYVLWVGTPLDVVRRRQEELLQVIEQLRSEFHASYTRIFLQLVLNLTGSGDTDPLRLAGTAFDEQQMLPRLEKAGNQTALFNAYHCKAMLCYLFGDVRQAAEHAATARRYEQGALASINIAQNVFYHSLALLAAWPALSVEERLRARVVLLWNRRRLRTWARHAPMNYLHKSQLVEAEWARVRGRSLEAVNLYEQALKGARAEGYLHEVALAAELAGIHQLSLGAERAARGYLRDAWQAWRSWGAVAKLRMLEARYSEQLRDLPETEEGALVSTAGSHRVRSSGTSSASLDLSAVLKASQALSGEIVLSQLLRRLMRILMENAGAQRGLLLLEHNGTLRVDAEGSMAEETVQVMASTPLELAGRPGGPRVAASVVQYVARTREPVVLDDASSTGRFMDDPHVASEKVRSVLCTPLVNQGRLVGVIYLENNLTSRAFTAERLEMLRLLASQAAIAIQNARLYTDLDNHSRELARINQSLSRFVPNEFLACLGKQSMVEVELGEHVRKEMSVLFSDIRGFTPIVERLQPQQHIDFINTYLSYMEPSIVNNRGFVDSYIGDAIMALFDGDADTAVKAGIDMSVSLQRLNVVRARQEQPPVRMGIGVNTGMLTLGTIGGSARIKCGVIGDPVNLAARVESLSKTYGAFLLITHHTHGRLRDPARYALRIVDRVTVKGKTEPVTLYEVLDAESPELKGPKLELLPVYNEAVALYFRAEFAAASRLFGECVSRCPGDVAARGLMSRCLKYLDAGVPAGWDGVVTLDHK